MEYRRRTKEERKAWWSGLTPEERATYVRKKAGEKQEDGKLLDLSPQQIRKINQTMRNIGMESHIVLQEKA